MPSRKRQLYLGNEKLQEEEIVGPGSCAVTVLLLNPEDEGNTIFRNIKVLRVAEDNGTRGRRNINTLTLKKA